jgi:hypothetical protein
MLIAGFVQQYNTAGKGMRNRGAIVCRDMHCNCLSAG